MSGYMLGRPNPRIALCGISGYDSVVMKVKGVSQKIYLIALGERHDPPEYGCGKGNIHSSILTSGNENALRGYSHVWVHHYVHALLESAARSDVRSQNESPVRIRTIHLLENPMHEFNGCDNKTTLVEVPKQCMTLLRSSGIKGDSMGCALNSDSNKTLLKMNPHARRKAMQIIRESLCHSNRSALSAIRGMYDSCGRKSREENKSCPLASKTTVEVYHFDIRMIRVGPGGFGAVVNPFTELCNALSFIKVMLGPCPRVLGSPTGITPTSEGTLAQRKGIVQFILGPLFPEILKTDESIDFEASIMRRVHEFLEASWDKYASTYRASLDDTHDVHAVECLKSVSNLGPPGSVTRLIREMNQMAHDEMKKNMESAIKATSTRTVTRLIEDYVHFVSSIYRRPQLKDSWQAYYTMRMGHTVEYMGISRDKVRELRKRWFRGEPVRPYFTDVNMRHAVLQTRKQNVLSLMTDTYTDLNTLLKMIACIGNGANRILMYGGLAHMKNIVRFLVYESHGVSSIPPETRVPCTTGSGQCTDKIKTDGYPMVNVISRDHKRCEFTAPMPKQVIRETQEDSFSGELWHDKISSMGIYEQALRWVNAAQS